MCQAQSLWLCYAFFPAFKKQRLLYLIYNNNNLFYNGKIMPNLILSTRALKAVEMELICFITMVFTPSVSTKS